MNDTVESIETMLNNITMTCDAPNAVPAKHKLLIDGFTVHVEN